MTEWAVVNGIAAYPKSTKIGSRRNLIGAPGTYINRMIDSGLIEAHENGWIVVDPGRRDGLMLIKNS